jgi:hypothetical protein
VRQDQHPRRSEMDAAVKETVVRARTAANRRLAADFRDCARPLGLPHDVSLDDWRMMLGWLPTRQASLGVVPRGLTGPVLQVLRSRMSS